MAIKTYTWHYTVVPINDTYGFDLLITMQDFQPGLVSVNSNVTINFNSIKNVWMESEDEYIFEAFYKAGGYNANGKSSGQLYQNGCRYLANQGKGYRDIVRYYYNDSIINADDKYKICYLGKIRFFNSAKLCYK